MHTLAENIDTEIRHMRQYLHPAVHPVQWMAAVITEVNKLDSEVVTFDSVMESIQKLAQTGLYLGSALGHAYLVPYKAKCALQIGYKGFIELGLANGSIKGLSVDVILTGETYSYHKDTLPGSVAKFRHDLCIADRGIGTPQNIEAAYCIYETDASFRDVVIVGKRELQDLQKKSQQSSPWRTRYHAMALKTPIRRASKLWRQTKELAIAREADEESEQVWEREPHENPTQIENATVIQPRGERDVTKEDCRKLLAAWRTARTANEEPTEVVDFEVWVSQVTSMTPQSVKNPASWSRENLDKCYADLKEAASA